MYVCTYVCMYVCYRYGPTPLQLVSSFHSRHWMQRHGQPSSPMPKRIPRKATAGGGASCLTGGTRCLATPAADARTETEKCGGASCLAAPQPKRSPGKWTAPEGVASPPPQPWKNAAAHAASSSRSASSKTQKKKAAAAAVTRLAARVALLTERKKGNEHRGGASSTCDLRPSRQRKNKGGKKKPK